MAPATPISTGTGTIRDALAVGVDVGPVECGRHPVGWFFERDRAGGVIAREDCLRDLYHPAAISTELLVRECLVKDSDPLTGLYEADRSRRNEQLGFESAVVRNDLHLQSPRIRKLANRGLQGRDASGRRRPDD